MCCAPHPAGSVAGGAGGVADAAAGCSARCDGECTNDSCDTHAGLQRLACAKSTAPEPHSIAPRPGTAMHPPHVLPHAWSADDASADSPALSCSPFASALREHRLRAEQRRTLAAAAAAAAAVTAAASTPVSAPLPGVGTRGLPSNVPHIRELQPPSPSSSTLLNPAKATPTDTKKDFAPQPAAKDPAATHLSKDIATTRATKDTPTTRAAKDIAPKGESTAPRTALSRTDTCATAGTTGTAGTAGNDSDGSDGVPSFRRTSSRAPSTGTGSPCSTATEDSDDALDTHRMRGDGTRDSTPPPNDTEDIIGTNTAKTEDTTDISDIANMPANTTATATVITHDTAVGSKNNASHGNAEVSKPAAAATAAEAAAAAVSASRTLRLEGSMDGTTLPSVVAHVTSGVPYLPDLPGIDYGGASLIIRQQPIRARTIGFGTKDRRPIAPPPILQISIPPGAAQARILHEHGRFVCHASLCSEDMKHDLSLILSPGAPSNVTISAGLPPEVASGTPFQINRSDFVRSLIGPTTASCQVARDLDDAEKMFFIFPDLCVRMSGRFRLCFRLYHIAGHWREDGSIDLFPPRQEPLFDPIFSDVFTVYFPKWFPGMLNVTPLTRCLSFQASRSHSSKGTPGDVNTQPTSPTSSAHSISGARRSRSKKSAVNLLATNRVFSTVSGPTSSVPSLSPFSTPLSKAEEPTSYFASSLEDNYSLLDDDRSNHHQSHPPQVTKRRRVSNPRNDANSVKSHDHTNPSKDANENLTRDAIDRRPNAPMQSSRLKISVNRSPSDSNDVSGKRNGRYAHSNSSDGELVPSDYLLDDDIDGDWVSKGEANAGLTFDNTDETTMSDCKEEDAMESDNVEIGTKISKVEEDDQKKRSPLNMLAETAQALRDKER